MIDVSSSLVDWMKNYKLSSTRGTIKTAISFRISCTNNKHTQYELWKKLLGYARREKGITIAGKYVNEGIIGDDSEHTLE